jgi:hypothetical protein
VRLLFGLFLIAHGLIHVGVWATPRGGAAPFDPSHSWALAAAGGSQGAMRTTSIVLAAIAALAFVAAGGAVLANGQAWKLLTLVGAIVSLIATVLFFNPWLSLAVVIDVLLAADVLVWQWPVRG